MIVIIRIHSKGNIEPVWDELLYQKDAIQSGLNDKCHLLYLTKRLGFHDEASILADIADLPTLGDLLVTHLSRIKDIDNFVVHHLFRPKFYPLPKDTRNFKRFVINLKVEPAYLGEVYKKLIDPNIPDGLKKVYFAFTFHSSVDSLQFSLLAQSEDILRKYVVEVIDRLPGMLKTTTFPIERTKPLIAYDTWQDYAKQNPAALDWLHLRGHV